MIKRTKGYLLLTLLVLTGLAGRIHSDSLTGKERRFLNNHLKETKSAFLKSANNLTDAQLNFKPAPDRWSIKECIMHIALSENMMWDMAVKAMKEPGGTAQSMVKDEDVIRMMTDRSNKVKTFAPLEPEAAKFSSAEAALDNFKTNRQNLIKYVKTTTEDVRSHTTKLPFGTVDVYQLMLGISGHTARHTAQIEEIKADPNYPR
jgi:hypothetical protein